MSDPWLPPSSDPSNPSNPGQPSPPPYYAPPPGSYGSYGGYAPPGYPPPGAYPPAQYGYGQFYGGNGRPGEIRATGMSILWFVCTLGLYGLYYNFKVHDEMKRYSGRGIGGGIALLLTVIAGIAMPFVTPAEVGSLYARRGERPPVTGWTGLWYASIYLLYPIFIVMFLIAFSVSSASSDGSTSSSDVWGVGVVVIAIGVLVAALAGAVTWFVKTNGALNRYWASVGQAPPQIASW